jgi:hypothetical protein
MPESSYYISNYHTFIALNGLIPEEMYSLKLFLLSLALMIFLLIPAVLIAQKCELWSEPDSLSDSQSDNYDPFLLNIPIDYDTYYVFWVRFLEVFGTEIVYENYYGQGGPESVLLAEGYNVSNPRVIYVGNWQYPPSDTIAFIFYETDQASSQDIYYTVMTTGGFTEPEPFVNSEADETHLRISIDGSMVWEEGGAIKYCKLGLDATGFYFTPAVIIDEGDCRNPVLNKGNTDCIAWEKGNPDAPEIWYSLWDYVNDEWGEPVILFEDGMHTNLKIGKGMDDWGGWTSVITTDYLDSTGQYHFSYYDIYDSWEVRSEFTQDIPMDPELFVIDIITDFWGTGFMAFTHDEGMGNRDIYCSDYQEVPQYFFGYCSVDSTSQPESHAQLFMGPWFGDGFELICIWESFRNGHSQLYTSRVPVIIGSIAETQENGLQAKVYPNPFDEFFRIELLADETSDASIHMFNAVGQLVKKIDRFQLVKGNNLIKIETGQLPPGIYLVRIEAEDILGITRVVKR